MPRHVWGRTCRRPSGLGDAVVSLFRLDVGTPVTTMSRAGNLMGVPRTGDDVLWRRQSVAALPHFCPSLPCRPTFDAPKRSRCELPTSVFESWRQLEQVIPHHPHGAGARFIAFSSFPICSSDVSRPERRAPCALGGWPCVRHRRASGAIRQQARAGHPPWPLRSPRHPRSLLKPTPLSDHSKGGLTAPAIGRCAMRTARRARALLVLG
jgi:hypothetical protein